MPRATAIVPTAHASRYLQQLCKLWTHKFAVEFTPEHGTIDLGEGRVVILDADAEKLTATVEASQENLASLEDVVASHIVRFAFREELAFNWATE
ncbi:MULTISPECIES: DUF2218 domain-containing protein [Brucella]|uniref:DUF2218 domain-containing protein n=1 Tax=Brucella ceti M644/93/1 TaxID=520459 RepID=A0ABM9ZF08_9HYPH|nr:MULTISPECIES: DUF2218 domain-containing protein [Brucella]EEX90710.1 conserved hypothetical protein [Brucella ceti M13/05/1]EEX98299.1 conserved hypothetical protein [Brucella ceti M644/93/1]ENR10915.1 hypothetical protein C068_01129 [Brucella sp. UK38/05]ENT10075.1 hypothetical protein C001_01567 [Brucella sp. F5/06]